MADDNTTSAPAPAPMSDAEWRYLTYGEGTPPAPQAPQAALSTFAQARADIDSMRADPGSAYYQGGVGISAGEIQSLDRDLIRGQLAGADGPIEAAFEPDLDTPHHVTAYRVSNNVTDASTRAVVDYFQSAFIEAGVGDQKQFEFQQWWLGTPDATVERAEQFLLSRGWHSRQIAAFANRYRQATQTK